VRPALALLLAAACSRDPGPPPTRVHTPAAPAAAPTPQPPGSPRACLREAMASEAAVRCWVEWLAAPALAGRAPGSRGGETARAGLAAVFTDLSLEPGGDDDTYLQALPRGANVLALIPGRDPAREDEVIVVGAHYDHLGEIGGAVHPGADDNASGVAVLLELARRVVRDPPARSVLIAAFDAEEPPNYRTAAMGSQHWVDHPTLAPGRVVAMLAMDLMGGNLWPGARTPVYVMGRETIAAAGAPDLALAPIRAEAMHLRLVEDLPTGRQAFSDHGAFFAAKIPVVFVSTGRSPHYHRTTDVPASLDYGKLAAGVEVVEAHVRWLADLPEKPGWRADPPVTAGDAAAVLRLLDAGGAPDGSPERPGVAASAVAGDRARLQPLAAGDRATPLAADAARLVIAASLRAQCLLTPDDELPTAACLALGQ
jgi:hypothetical protein